MVFCITYTLACVCITFPYLPILLVGRFLGGVSTSILFSAFESWLISSASSASLASADLSTIMGRATLINGIVATIAGVVSNQLVESTKNYAVPFIASGALLILGWCVIRGTWTENYGATSAKNDDLFQVKRLGVAWGIVRQGQYRYLPFFSSRIKNPYRSPPPSPRPNTNMLRRLHVPLRLPLGPRPPRIRILLPRTAASLGLHLLLLHDIHDARVPTVHRHFILPRFPNSSRRLELDTPC